MENLKKKVSVVVTSYNYDEYIRTTLESLVNQTYKDFEVIIVDDGSKDNSLDIINEFVSKYSNFKLYTHENHQNKGLIESVKLGISKCNSDYIAFLESDDYWREDYLQQKIDYIEEHPDAVIIINDITPFGNNTYDKYVTKIANYYRKNKTKKNYFLDFITENRIGTFSIVMIKSDVLRSLDFDSPIQTWLDYWLWRQVTLCHPISFVDEKLTYWNRHDNSYITQTGKDKTKPFEVFYAKSDKLLRKKYPSFYQKNLLQIYARLLVKNIFSIQNSFDKSHKIISILGFKIKYKII